MEDLRADPEPTRAKSGPSAHRTPVSAFAFAVIMVVLVVVLFATMYINSGWIGILWAVLSLLAAFLFLVVLYLLESRLTRTTKRGLAAGMFLVGVMLVSVGYGGAAIMAGVNAVHGPSLYLLVGELGLAVTGAVLIALSVLLFRKRRDEPSDKGSLP